MILNDVTANTIVDGASGPAKPIPLADGSIIAQVNYRFGRRGLVRFDAGGQRDLNFAAEFGDNISITGFTPLSSGQILIWGSFTSFNGEAQAYLARLTPDTRAATTHLSNLSIRAWTGIDTLTVGFVIANGGKNLLIRGAGPALASFDVPDTLADPVLTLFLGQQPQLSNDNWSSANAPAVIEASTRVGAFPFTAGSLDAAMLATLPAGPYTVQLSGKPASAGIALAELYDSDLPPADARAPRLINISARTQSGTGADIFTVGFIISGDNTRRILVRAVGPSLAQFNVTGALADPVLTLYRSTTPIASNDDWGRTPMLTEAMNAVGAFSLNLASKDAALVLSLAPGIYTALVTGASNTTGVALVEVYEVP